MKKRKEALNEHLPAKKTPDTLESSKRQAEQELNERNKDVAGLSDANKVSESKDEGQSAAIGASD